MTRHYRYSTDDRINTECRRLVSAGWTLESGRHDKLRHPDGRRIIAIPGTPSDRRSALNWKTRVKRMENAS